MEINYERIKKMPPLTAIMNVTDECNLRCKYCFTHPHPTNMPLKVGIDAVKWLVSNYEKRPDEKKDHIRINFFGGEPMLRYEQLMVPLMEWADINVHLSKGHKIFWGMTTNGTLLTSDRLRYLSKRKDFSILFSCDGDQYTQDLQRKTASGEGTFKMIEPIMSDIIKYFPNTTFRSTITPESVDHLLENFLFARSKGFKNFFAMPNCREEWSKDAVTELGFQLSNIGYVLYQDIKNQNNSFCSYNDLIRYMLYFYLSKKEKIIDCSHCGFGCGSVGISTNGIITGCQERNTFCENDLFTIGNIYNGISSEKHLKLMNDIIEHSHRENAHLDCSKCPIKEKCSERICPSINYDMCGSVYTSPDIMCYWHTIMYKVAKNICDTAALDNDKIFLDFLTQKSKEEIKSM